MKPTARNKFSSLKIAASRSLHNTHKQVCKRHLDVIQGSKGQLFSHTAAVRHCQNEAVCRLWLSKQVHRLWCKLSTHRLSCFLFPFLWDKGSLCTSVGTKGVHYHIHLLSFLYWQAQVFNMKMIAEKPKHRSIYRTIILRWKSKDYFAKGILANTQQLLCAVTALEARSRYWRAVTEKGGNEVSDWEVSECEHLQKPCGMGCSLPSQKLMPELGLPGRKAVRIEWAAGHPQAPHS